MPLEPDSLTELQDAVRSHPFVIPVGAGTKPALSAVPESYLRIGLTRLTGIVEYDPSEFTITVLAGTPVSEVQATLARHGQHLPFDPPLAAKGATIGGTVAAGLSGPGAFRFGPLRDFLIGVRFVDGEGRLLTGGGKVVKNAAGFDLPKFLIGSAGRLGILVELTFKVFPQPEASATFAVAMPGDLRQVTQWIGRFSRSPHDLEALEFEPHENILWGRLAGNRSALKPRLQRIEQDFGLQGNFVHCDPDEAAFFWNRQLDFAWAEPDRWLVKIPITPDQIETLDPLLARPGISRRYGMGGNVAWVAGVAEQIAALNVKTDQCLMLRLPEEGNRNISCGSCGPVKGALKSAFDPEGRFPNW